MGHDLLILAAGAIIAIFVNYLTTYTSSPLAQKISKWRDDRAQKKLYGQLKMQRKESKLLKRN
jgi:hypothetical protein